MAQTEVIDRFEGLNPKFKILSLPNFNVFNPQARAKILKEGIKVFETEKIIGKKDFRNANFFKLKAKLKQFITSLLNSEKEFAKFKKLENQKLADCLNNQHHSSSHEKIIRQSLLDNSYNVNNVVNTNKIEHRPSINYADITEFIVEYSQIVKIEETKRLRELYGG